jgi:hypothetical protein
MTQAQQYEILQRMQRDIHALKDALLIGATVDYEPVVPFLVFADGTSCPQF